MDAVSDSGASLPSCGPSPALGGSRARRSAASGAAAGDASSVLALREECTQAKQRERAAEEKMRHLAAQLARTEEAAKRILTRTDASARGGVAQRLLDTERELARVQAELAERGSELARVKRQATERKRQAAELKERLDAALSSQRQLALQLGRAQAGRGLGTSLGAYTSRTVGSRGPGPALGLGAAPGAEDDRAEPLAEGAAAEAEAAVARRFAVQQEQLAAAHEARARLELHLRQQQQAMEQQARELSTLRAQLASGPPLAACHLAASQQGPGAVPVGSNCRRRTSSAGSEGGDAAGGDAAWLRLKLVESRRAVERCTAHNARLLREVEGARAEVRQLRQLQQQQEHGRQQHGQHDGQLAWEQEQQPARQDSSGAPWLSGAPSGSRHSPDKSAAPPAGLPAAVLDLRQQLAAANHRAARLQIELGAAVAKLSVYAGAQVGGSNTQQEAWQPPPLHQQQAMPGRGPSQQQPLHPWQPVQQQPEQPQRVDGWCRGTRRESVQHSAVTVSPAHSELEAWHAQQRAASRGPAVPAVVELHLHGAELDESSMPGPLGLTFLTANLSGFPTAMTPFAEGPDPRFDATLQFVLDGSGPSTASLAASQARVELHCCRSASSGGSAGYITVGTARLPLAALMAPPGKEGAAAGQRRQCTLYSKEGVAVGSLWYGIGIQAADST